VRPHLQKCCKFFTWAKGGKMTGGKKRPRLEHTKKHLIPKKMTAEAAKATPAAATPSMDFVRKQRLRKFEAKTGEKQVQNNASDWKSRESLVTAGILPPVNPTPSQSSCVFQRPLNNGASSSSTSTGTTGETPSTLTSSGSTGGQDPWADYQGVIDISSDDDSCRIIENHGN
jgi:hypothetical protein